MRIMTYEIVEENREPVSIVSVRMTSSMSQIPNDLGNMFSQVIAYLNEVGVTPSGPPFARYHAMTEDSIDLEAGVPVPEPLPGNDTVQSSKLPGGNVAVAWYGGPYGEAMGAAYQAIEEWMSSRNRVPAGAPWEVYWTDPGEEPDPEKWRTEIIWPFRAA